MTELYIHIGSHKTGTTSIQRACVRYLLSEGEVSTKYINLRPSGTKIVRSSGRLGDFRAWVDMEAANDVLRPEVVGAGSSDSRYIVSDEDFFWISDPETVEMLAVMLKERFDSIRIICYLRRQDLLAVSHRKQVSEGIGMAAARFYGVSAAPLPLYQDHFLSYFDYAAKLSNVWVSAFGSSNVTIMPFEQTALVGGDVVVDFAHRVKVKFSSPEPVKVNTSRAGDETLMALKLTEYNVPLWLRRKIMNSLPGVGQFLPTRHEAQEFLSHFSASNDELSRLWTWNGAPMTFTDSFTMYPESVDGHWSSENVADILDAIFSSVFSKNNKGLRRLIEELYPSAGK